MDGSRLVFTILLDSLEQLDGQSLSSITVTVREDLAIWQLILAYTWRGAIYTVRMSVDDAGLVDIDLDGECHTIVLSII